MWNKPFYSCSIYLIINLLPINYLRYRVHVYSIDSGLDKKLLTGSNCLVQADFPARQVMFHSHLHNGQRPRQVVFQLSKRKVN